MIYTYKTNINNSSVCMWPHGQSVLWWRSR